MKDRLALLKRLSETVGVSGREEAVRELIFETIQPHVDQVQVDALGNMLALKRGTGQEPLKVMIAAHMDEVGFMITGHEGNGGLAFRPVGGLRSQVLLGKRVQVGSDQVPGVIGIKPIHLTKKAEKRKITNIESLVIDVGASSKEEAQKIAEIGDLATFMTPFTDLGPTILGKAFDDRVGCVALIELLHGERLPFDLQATFSVQEEVGLRGARVAAYTLEPDAAFVLDCTPANDLPMKQDLSPNTILGQGPAIYVMGSRLPYDRRLIELLKRAGDEEGIPYQIRPPGGGGTDANAIIGTRAGVPAVSVSAPARYIHSPAAIVDKEDLANVPRLIRAALSRLTHRTLQR